MPSYKEEKWWETSWFFVIAAVAAVAVAPLLIGGVLFVFAQMIAFVESWPWPCIGRWCDG